MRRVFDPMPATVEMGTDGATRRLWTVASVAGRGELCMEQEK
jgi:hypothetical protein